MNVRNVVVLGECGVGKSSIINMISGAQTTKTSSNVLGESPVSCRVVVMESGLRVNFWEMKGLPGDVGTAPTRLLRDLKTIVRRLLVFLSIDLLLFCIRAGSVTSAFVQGYQAIYVDVCARKVPIALVINGLEGSSGLDMHGWWAKNKDRLFNRGLAFDIHACVTTLSSDEDPSIREQIKTSQRRLRKLVDLPDYFGLPNHLVCPRVPNLLPYLPMRLLARVNPSNLQPLTESHRIIPRTNRRAQFRDLRHPALPSRFMNSVPMTSSYFSWGAQDAAKVRLSAD
ncbi:hypothetical protein EDD17DRAFT_994506 [Pisolithus thermaeus]|nr:hypothetical protein EDD17DRAFT_994506 [Pisolithus thermaeus]